jgi:S1-C subfamily serine protease
LLSNRHVVEAARTLEVLTWDGVDATATGAQISKSVDVGVLGGEWELVKGLQPLPVRNERVAPGDRVAIVGFPEGQELAISTGVAVSYEVDTEVGTVELLKATTVVKPGNSGGPALDDQGRVIGMVFAELIAADEALIIPWDVIASLTPADFETDSGCS